MWVNHGPGASHDQTCFLVCCSLNNGRTLLRRRRRPGWWTKNSQNWVSMTEAERLAMIKKMVER